MRVLVGCEESGVVRRAFRSRGHEAFSCDLLPARDGEEAHHIQADVMDAIRLGPWDIIILHPPCDFLAVSGNRWYGHGTPGFERRLQAIRWTASLWKLAKANSPRVALENPTSVIFPILRREARVQFVQPWMFGHEEKKRTGFALHGLPELEPTDVVDLPVPGSEEDLRWQRVWRMAPGADRKRDRSTTYAGIAEAMADQWGNLD